MGRAVRDAAAGLTRLDQDHFVVGTSQQFPGHQYARAAPADYRHRTPPHSHPIRTKATYPIGTIGE
jgi:hypothetical protein